MKTLRDLINRLQAIKDTGSMLPLSNFIEELERQQAILDEQPEPVPPVEAPVEAPVAGPNSPAELGVEPTNGIPAEPNAENIDPNFIDPDAAPDTTDTP